MPQNETFVFSYTLRGNLTITVVTEEGEGRDDLENRAYQGAREAVESVTCDDESVTNFMAWRADVEREEV